MKRRRAGRTGKKAAAGKKKTSARQSSGRKMWVRTDDGKVVWVDDASDMPTPEEVREAERERKRKKREARERARRAREPISFKCPTCKRGIQAPRTKCGERITCKCGSKMLVPDPPDAPKERIAVECLSCGKPHLPSVDRCDACGDMMPKQKSCASCGQMWLRASVGYCPRCGLELEAVSKDAPS